MYIRGRVARETNTPPPPPEQPPRTSGCDSEVRLFIVTPSKVSWKLTKPFSRLRRFHYLDFRSYDVFADPAARASRRAVGLDDSDTWITDSTMNLLLGTGAWIRRTFFVESIKTEIRWLSLGAFCHYDFAQPLTPSVDQRHLFKRKLV